MAYTYEDRRSFFYISRLVAHSACPAKDFNADLLHWAYLAGINKKAKVLKKGFRQTQEVCKALQKLAAGTGGNAGGVLQKNLSCLAGLLGLKQAEEQMLEGAFLWRKNQYLRSFARGCFNGTDLLFEHLAAFADMDEDSAQSLLISQAPLMRFGLLEMRRCFHNEYSIPLPMREFIKAKYSNLQQMKAALLGAPFQGEWKAKDFDYMRETALAVKLMKHIGKKKGVNVLLYGQPGTGKTCFAQMLAASAGRELYGVGEDGNEERLRNYRLQKMYQKLNLLEKHSRACLLFDEAEDMFSSRLNPCDKVEINRLLENNTTPVIWTTNAIERMDPAFIRRFTLAVYFERPPVAVRQKMWSSYLKKSHLPHQAAQVRALAQEFSVAPSFIEGAAQTAGMVKGNLDTVRQHLQMMQQAMRGGRKTLPKKSPQGAFNPALVHADCDLQTLTKQIKKLGRLDFSLCLYGVSGTGKSAYARYLARELGLESLQRRASDLVSPFVGETEKNIAGAFARAREEKALLIFDEADSFLQDRARASHSWEISAVNEMLTWMENHPYPFICTTNLMETLDPASLRRFSFKVKYDFLTPQQAQQAFYYFFRLHLSQAQTADLEHLTPGDFALVKNKAEILGCLHQKEALLDLLHQEQSVKMRHIQPQVGFCK